MMNHAVHAIAWITNAATIHSQRREGRLFVGSFVVFISVPLQQARLGSEEIDLALQFE